MIFREKAPLWPVGGSRILIGILWLFSLRWKLPPAFIPASGKGLMDWPWSYMMMAMWHGTFIVMGAGRVFGVDGWLRERKTAVSWLRWLT